MHPFLLLIVAFQLTLTIPRGACHRLAYAERLDSWSSTTGVVSLLKSSMETLASLNTSVGCLKIPPCTTLFLWNQMLRTTASVIANSSSSHRSLNSSNIIVKVFPIPLIFWILFNLQLYTSWAEGQFQRIWTKDSTSITQIRHCFSNKTRLRKRFSIVGRTLLKALHKHF